MYDTIIVGGGPAGLSAALILGRCRRRVIVCDAGNPRNAASHSLHGFLSWDGCNPAKLPQTARDQLTPYGMELWQTLVTDAARKNSHFEVGLDDGTRLASRKLLLATGIVDNMPNSEGFDGLYGRSVFHCPYCDGWEVRDQPLAVYARGPSGIQYAVGLTNWSNDIVLCTDGEAGFTGAEKKQLARYNIGLNEAPIARLERIDGSLQRIVFTSGEILERSALLFSLGQSQRSDLAVQFGCKVPTQHGVETGQPQYPACMW